MGSNHCVLNRERYELLTRYQVACCDSSSTLPNRSIASHRPTVARHSNGITMGEVGASSMLVLVLASHIHRGLVRACCFTCGVEVGGDELRWLDWLQGPLALHYALLLSGLDSFL